jgi:hypothetical protein
MLPDALDEEKLRAREGELWKRLAALAEPIVSELAALHAARQDHADRLERARQRRAY